MAQDNVKVAVRLRPLNQRETDLGCADILHCDADSNSVGISNPGNESRKSFSFDYVFSRESPQDLVYEEVGYPLVESVLEGYNGTIFAYGQTGCGKTHTMEGGILPQAFRHLFDRVNTQTDNSKFLIRVGYVEIYNEEIRDLLDSETDRQKKLREDPDRGVFVAGQKWVVVTSAAETMNMLRLGKKTRVVAATDMNSVSSRSHAIFMLSVETSSVQADTTEVIRVGKLNLVDLAGSERQTKTKSSGQRLKEATKINLSLSALGNVISALVSNANGKHCHIPYRDSKLTRLLQDSLGGNTKTAMIACVSPAEDNYDETLSTLRYANRAKNIRNKPKVNEDPKDALLKEYQQEIAKLRDMLAIQGVSKSTPSPMAMGQGSGSSTATHQYALEYSELTKQLEAMSEERQNLQAMKDQWLAEKEELQREKQVILAEKERLEERVNEQMTEEMSEQRLEQMEIHREERAKQRRARQQSMAATIDECDSRLVDELRQELREAQQEIADSYAEFEEARQDLLENIRESYRESLLYQSVLELCLSSDAIDEIVFRSSWNAETEQWNLPGIAERYAKDYRSKQQPKKPVRPTSRRIKTKRRNSAADAAAFPVLELHNLISKVEEKQRLQNAELLPSLEKTGGEQVSFEEEMAVRKKYLRRKIG